MGTLAAAVLELAKLPGAQLAGVSRLYATAPVGVVGQPEFRNAVAALDVASPDPPGRAAGRLLVQLKALERRFGRRQREHWGPRELDLDLLVFGRARIDASRPPGGQSTDPTKGRLPLVVPHPEARQRLFVLAPLSDLAPDLIPPGWDERVEEARDRREAAEGPNAVRPVARWAGDRWAPV